jgi:nitroreductase
MSNTDTDRAPREALGFVRKSEDEMRQVAADVFGSLSTRRSVREFSSEPIPLDVVRHAIHTAAQAPSGAHKQPWTFVLVTDPGIKKQIRDAAEQEERAFYGGRAGDQWLSDLTPFGTDANKDFLEIAPALIVVFSQTRGDAGDKHYYVKESVGIAVGMLIATLHLSGLATLTHTPAPMEFLRTLLQRPTNEKAFVILPVGYPAEDCQVPRLRRKGLAEVLTEI